MLLPYSPLIQEVFDTASNLRTPMLRIAEHAGLKPCPKLFLNFHATRTTELAYAAVCDPPQLVSTCIVGVPRLEQVLESPEFKPVLEKALHYALQKLMEEARAGQ